MLTRKSDAVRPSFRYKIFLIIFNKNLLSNLVLYKTTFKIKALRILENYKIMDQKIV